MKEEEELQYKIEEGKLLDFEKNDVHAKVYQQVFKSLNTMDSYTLPSSFADNVVNKVTESQTSKVLSSDHIWFGTGIAVVLISSIVALRLLNVEFEFELDFDFGFLKSMSGYKGLFFFGVSFILLLNLMDKFLLRNKNKVSI